MSVDCFLDTNVLLYAATASTDEVSKQDAALDLIAADSFAISTQIIQEFYHNATLKVRRKMRAEAAIAWLAEIEHRPCVTVDRDVIAHTIEVSRRFRISYWDGAIVAAAEAVGATTLFTEDLNHGQLYGPVRAINPFLDLPPA